jgi:hypothetical protein
MKIIPINETLIEMKSKKGFLTEKLRLVFFCLSLFHSSLMLKNACRERDDVLS